MTRITIEVDAAGGVSQTSSTQGSAQAQTQAQSSPGAAAVPADILAKAAATRALNAGPAPSMGGSTPSAPQPFISSQAQAPAVVGATSAGAAPQK
jgi:hypothetical protein